MKEKTPQPFSTFTQDDIRQLIFQDLDDPPNMIDLQKSIIKWAVELLQANAGEIFLWDPEKQALVLALPTGYTQSYSDKFEGVALKSGEGLAGKAFQNLTPMIVEDYYDWEGRSNIFTDGQEYVLNSVLAAPMVWQGIPIGVLTINAYSEKKIFTEDDIRLAALFSNIAAVSIMNARLYGVLQVQTRSIQNALHQEVEARTAELKRHALQLNLSAQVSREITSILDLDRLLTQVVNLIRSTFGYYCVQVFLYSETTNNLTLRAVGSQQGEKISKRLMQVHLDDTSLNGQAAFTRELVVANDVNLISNFQFDDLLPLTQSEFVMPLQVSNQLLGTLDVQSSKKNVFNQQEVLMLQSLGDQVAIAIQNTYFYERSKELAVLEERNRMARELHDSVTQSLFSMDLHAKAIATYIDKDPDKAQQQIQELRQTTHDTLQEMRSLIYDLRPIPLHSIGLQQALKEQIDRFHEVDIKFILQINCNRSLPDAVEMCLFRVAQEALRNAVKHAASTQIICTLECTLGQVLLTVQDNGRGFRTDAPASRQSFGLLGMRERTELLDGNFTIETDHGRGTKIVAVIPI